MPTQGQTPENHNDAETRPLYQLRHLVEMLKRQEQARQERERRKQEPKP